MRTWRVGTFSMGASLLLLGVFLLFSQIFGIDMFHVMTSWWPVILVVLGVEILVYLFLSKQEKPILKYDFISIFFVGIIGSVGIAFAILSSTGIMEQVNTVIDGKERTFDLPEFTHTLDPEVKRVVVNASRYPLTIEGTTSEEVSLFGTYTASVSKEKKLISKAEDYVLMEQKGDTLYVNVKVLPTQTTGPFHMYSDMNATILIPARAKLEVMGNDNSITMKPRTLMSDWKIDRASNVSLHLEKESDISVSANSVQEIVNHQNEWKITEHNSINKDHQMEEPHGIKDATFKIGKGTHQINISNVYSVNLNTFE